MASLCQWVFWGSTHTRVPWWLHKSECWRTLSTGRPLALHTLICSLTHTFLNMSLCVCIFDITLMSGFKLHVLWWEGVTLQHINRAQRSLSEKQRAQRPELESDRGLISKQVFWQQNNFFNYTVSHQTKEVSSPGEKKKSQARLQLFRFFLCFAPGKWLIGQHNWINIESLCTCTSHYK